MNYIFEVIDKTGRKIRLTKKIWSKIRKKHYEIENEESKFACEIVEISYCKDDEDA